MVKHDSLDKVPLNDEVLSRKQKLYSGSRFKSYKVYFYHVPDYRSCQVISQWMQACYTRKLLWVTVYYTSVTSIFILKCKTIYKTC